MNLAFVLDRSGSMQGRGKLDLAKQAVDEALARLDPEDRFSVVVYDDQVDVVAASHHASDKARRKASEALVSIEARGSTDLAGGWLAGCDQVARHLVESGVNRCLLLTDGLANVGIVDPAELERHAGELRARGVATTTFGVGEDFNESLLQAMADAGGGHFYFAASVVEIRDHITSEVGETLDVVARDVTLEVTAPETVRVESMAPFKTEARGSRTLIRIGDLVSGQVVRIVLRVTFPFGEVGREIGALVGVTDRDEVFREAEPALAPVALAWQYADNPANDAQPRDRDVDRVVAQIFAARARQEAVQLNRQGDYAAAQKALAGVSRRIRDYASGDPQLQEIAASLRMEVPAYAAAMPEMARKSRHWAASNVARMRTAEGQSVKRPEELTFRGSPSRERSGARSPRAAIRARHVTTRASDREDDQQGGVRAWTSSSRTATRSSRGCRRSTSNGSSPIRTPCGGRCLTASSTSGRTSRSTERLPRWHVPRSVPNRQLWRPRPDGGRAAPPRQRAARLNGEVDRFIDTTRGPDHWTHNLYKNLVDATIVDIAPSEAKEPVGAGS